jgi:D-alanine-D-alanine ligase
VSRQKRIRVAVLFGGRSVEHEISVISALQLISAVDTLRYEPIPVYIDQDGRWHTGAALLQRSFYTQFAKRRTELTQVTLRPEPGLGGLSVIASNEMIPVDVFFPVFHGRFGEDGCIQGLFELTEIPYVGCGVLAASLSMSKQCCKEFVQAFQVPTVPGKLVTKASVLQNLQQALDDVIATPGLTQFPLFIKPNNSGSSIGIGRAKNREELAVCLARVFAFDHEALVERCMTDMFELNVSVVAGTEPSVSVIEMPVASDHALTYEDKYLRGGKKTGDSQGMASLTRLIDPPQISTELRSQVQKYALQVFKAMGCNGVARFDFIVDKQSGQPYFNEVNSPPGSLAFYLWEKTNPRLLYTELIERLIECAFARARERASLKSDIEFKALKN